MKYRSKPELVDAVQWNKMGDHPAVYLHGRVNNTRVYRLENSYETVCAGDYILTHSDGSLSVLSKEEFEGKYEKVEDVCERCRWKGSEKGCYHDDDRDCFESTEQW